MKKTLILFATFAALASSMAQAATVMRDLGPAVSAVSIQAKAHTVAPVAAVLEVELAVAHAVAPTLVARQTVPSTAPFRLTETAPRGQEDAQRATRTVGPGNSDQPEHPRMPSKLT